MELGGRIVVVRCRSYGAVGEMNSYEVWGGSSKMSLLWSCGGNELI